MVADETVACEATTEVAGRRIEHLVDLEAGTYTGRSHGHARPHGSARAVQPGRPRVVRHELRGPDRGSGRGLGGDRAWRAHADPRADGEWQDARRVPLRPRPPRSRPQPDRPPARTRATSASCTSARSRPSPTTSSATSAHRSPGSRSRPPASARPSHTSRSRAGPATRPRRIAARSPGARRTSSSRRLNRST